MAKTSFKTNPIFLVELLKSCGEGDIQLPDFQRSWVWEEDRIKSLIASVSRAFPIGALMTLQSKPGGPEILLPNVEMGWERSFRPIPASALADTALPASFHLQDVDDQVEAAGVEPASWIVVLTASTSLSAPFLSGSWLRRGSPGFRSHHVASPRPVGHSPAASPR